ncbi:MAG TPA: AtpZ/AtpI family protein [Stellaceae bacterium]|nr:AtpZ/AtpI family protein [Stellaceae bacterium]
MSENEPPDPLAGLGERLAKARRQIEQQRPAEGGAAPQGLAGLGFRIGIELVASLAVGVALGWVVDRLAHTRPWGIVAGFVLGAAAGLLNVMRAVGGGLPGGPPQRRNRDGNGR